MAYVSVSTYRDIDWELNQNPDNSMTVDQIACCLLADIRAELKSLNATLNCANTLDIPRRLKSIDRELKLARKEREAKK